MATSGCQIPNSDEPSKPLISIHFANCTQLTSTTYLSWKFHITHLLNGYGLFHFVDGSHPPPPKTVTPKPTATETDPALVPNPAYKTWFRQDQLILGAVAPTLHPSITPLIHNATTSHAAWTTLAQTYANPSRGHILQLKHRLSTITKGDKSITEFMQSVIDELALLGKPIDPEDIVATILNNLDETYKSIVDSVRARDTLITFEALHKKLSQHEFSNPPAPLSTAFPPLCPRCQLSFVSPCCLISFTVSFPCPCYPHQPLYQGDQTL